MIRDSLLGTLREVLFNAVVGRLPVWESVHMEIISDFEKEPSSARKEIFRLVGDSDIPKRKRKAAMALVSFYDGDLKTFDSILGTSPSSANKLWVMPVGYVALRHMIGGDYAWAHDVRAGILSRLGRHEDAKAIELGYVEDKSPDVVPTPRDC